MLKGHKPLTRTHVLLLLYAWREAGFPRIKSDKDRTIRCADFLTKREKFNAMQAVREVLNG